FPRARHLHTRHRNPLPGTGAFVVVATTATFFVVVATTATLIQGGRRVGRGRRGAGNGDGRVRTGDPGGTGGHAGGHPAGDGRGAGRADRRGRWAWGNAGCRQRRGTARFRGAAAWAGGHARARQRAGPHRVGGLRDRDKGRRRGRGDHADRHAAEQPAADDHDRRAGGQARRRPAVRARGRGLLGRRGARQRGRP